VGRNAECFDAVVNHLEARGIHIFQRVDEVADA